MKRYFFMFICLLLGIITKAQINITNSTVANTLVQKLVGPGVTFSAPTITCATNGAGFFTSTNPTLNIDSGIVLTTGFASNTGGNSGVNNSAGIFANVNRGFNAGDNDLFNLVSQFNSNLIASDINDVCVLKFNFIPQGDTLKFNYKFASEEYPDFVCSDFNDAFAFFISGGSQYPVPTNVAKIPGTNIPVAINSVNSGSPGFGYGISNCNALGPGSPFPSYFQNIASNNTIVYNGSTIKMQAIAPVTPCSTYTMKFVIADLLDHLYDSGVFLESGSFKTEALEIKSVKPSVAIPSTWPYITEGCRKDTITIKRLKVNNTAQQVFVTITGSATNGTDYTSIPTTLTIPANDSVVKIVINPLVDALVEGVETIFIGIKPLACLPDFSDTITIRINDYPRYSITDNDTVCTGNSFTLSATQIAIDTAQKFKWNPGNISGANYIITPITTSNYTVTSLYPGCPNRDSVVNIAVAPKPLITTIADTSICVGNSVLLSSVLNNSTLLYPATITWSSSAGTSSLSSNTLLSPIATPTSNITYTVTAVNGAGCSSTDAVNITLLPTPNLTISTVASACNISNGSINVIASSGTNLSYNLMPGNITQATGLFTNLPGNTIYTVTVTGTNICSKQSTVNLAGALSVNFTSFTKTNISCNGANNGQVNCTSSGTPSITYLLSPNNISNTSGSFNNLSPNNYSITVTDATGCTTISSFTIVEPNLLSISANNIIPISCFGNNNGAISTLTTGGSGFITYIMQPGSLFSTTGNYNNLAANNYSIIATDANGCKDTLNINLTQPPALNITSIDTTNAICNPSTSGSAIINVSGGSPNYNFVTNTLAGAFVSNSNNYNSYAAGNYSVTVSDANNCTTASTFTISSVLIPFINNAIFNPILCNIGNTTINIGVTNINPTIQFSIIPNTGINSNNGSFTNITAGIYNISITDANGCTSNTAINITQPNAIAINNISTTPTLCNGNNTGTININASGGTGLLTYTNVNNSNANTTGLFTALGASIYTISIVDANNCILTTTATVNSPSSLSWNNISSTNPLCNNSNTGSIIANALGGFGTISYSINNISTAMPANNLLANNYIITATDANNCSISTTVVLTNPNAVLIQNVFTTQASCVPGNDASITLNVNGGTGSFNYNLVGTSINTIGQFYNLAPATYQIIATDANGCSTSSFINCPAPVLPSITNININATACVPNNTGNATVSSTVNNNLLSYSLNNAVPQNSNVFNNLMAGNYSVIITDSLACKDTALFTINTTANPQISNVVSTPASCVPGCDGIFNINAFGGTGVLQYTHNSLAYQTSNTITNLCTANNYTIYVKDANGCTASSLAAIGIRPSPILNNFTSNNITCNGINNGIISATAINGTPTYTYTLNNSNANSTGTYPNLSPNNYTLTVTDVYGCSSASTAIITQPPVLNIVSVNSTIPTCYNGTNGSIVINATGGTGILSYTLNTTTQANGTFNNLAGNITYTITITDANNCSISSTLFLSQPPQIVFTSLSTDSANCWSTTNGAIYTSANGGTGLLNYTIYPATTTNTNGIFNNLFSSIYTVSVTDANNCTLTTTTFVGQPIALNFTNLSNINVSCFGLSNGSLTATAAGGIGTYTYTLQNTNTNNSTGSYNNLSSAIYSIMVTDAVGCTRVSTINITQPALLNFSTVLIQNNLCNGNTLGVISVNAAGGNGNNIYSILPNIQANNTNGVFSNLAAGSYTITVTDNNNCITTTTALVTQPNSLAINSANIINPICNGNNTGSFTIFSTGGTAPFNFNVNPGSLSNSTGIFTNLPANNYTVFATDNNGCTSSIQVNIFAPPPIKIDSFNKTNALCFGDSNASLIVYASGSISSLNYTLAPINLSNSTGVFNNLLANVYTITVSDNNNCSSSTFINIIQNTEIKQSTLSLKNPFCDGGTEGEISFSYTGGIAPLSYSFNSSPFSNNTFYNNLSLGAYTIIVKDAIGCTKSDIVVLNTPQPLTINIDSFKNELCYQGNNGSIYLSANFGNPGGYSFFVLPNNFINNTGNFTNIPPGTYTVVVRDILGCTGQTTVVINPSLDSVKINFSILPITCTGFAEDGAITALPISRYPPFTYNWLGNNNDSTQSINNLATGYYTVQVTDAVGCSNSASVLLPPSPCCEVYIPNIFSPNANGLNDVFIPKTSASTLLLRFQVFNRYGNMVFSTANPSTGWDGNYKNIPLDMDTYFYIYEYRCLQNNEIYKKVGDVILTK
jgi:large repetitive protein